MKNILIIDAGKEFGASQGKLSTHLCDIAEETLAKAGHSVKRTHVDSGYAHEEEVEKYLWADAVIYQMPAWWMGEPWTMKKYVDEVFMTGFGRLFKDDGRSSSNPKKNYGRGGLLQGKTYMLSVTWNAPAEAFTEVDEFFEGRGVEAVYFPFHKANQFIGLSPLPTFMCNDVIKAPDVENDVVRYQEHLNQYFA